MANAFDERFPEIDIEKRLHQNKKKFSKEIFRRGLKPTKMRLDILEWAKENVRIKGVRSGAFDVNVTPHMIEPYKCADFNSKVSKITLKMGSQMTKSTFAEICAGFYMTIGTGNIGYAAATNELLERIRAIRLDNIMNVVPDLKSQLKQLKESLGKKAKDKSTLLNFGSGYMAMMSLQSPSSISNLDCQILVLEELRDAPVNLAGQGCPVKILDKRSTTYGNRAKRIIPSTPGIRNDQNQEVTCKVHREFMRGSREYFKVPCPHCGEFQQLEPENAHIDKSRDIYGFSCTGCGELITEDYRDEIVSKGKYFAENPAMKAKHRSFHNNQFQTKRSIGNPWDTLLDEYIDAKDSETELITFVNTVMGQAYSKVKTDADWEKLSENKSDYAMNSAPAEVLYLTAGVDFQKTWIEYSVWGWDKQGRDYFIGRYEFREIDWNVAESSIAHVLAKISQTVIRCGDVDRRLAAAYLDVGYNPEKIAFAWECLGKPFNLRFIKGDSMPKKPNNNLGMTTIQSGTLKIQALRVNTFNAKREIYANYQLKEDQAGYNFFPLDCPDIIFQQLTSEVETISEKSKQLVFQKRSHWIRNEVLDCKVYANAAKDSLKQAIQSSGNIEKFAESFVIKYNVRKELKKQAQANKSIVNTIDYGED